MIIPQQAIEFQTAAFAFPDGIHFLCFSILPFPWSAEVAKLEK